MVKIAFFDEYVNSNKVEEYFMARVLSKQLCCSNQVKLRHSNKGVITYNTHGEGEYRSSLASFCLGVVYELEVDEEWLDFIVTSTDYHRTEININVIEATLEQIVSKTYKIIKKETVICYTANRKGRWTSLFNKRQNKIEMAKEMLNEVIC